MTPLSFFCCIIIIYLKWSTLRSQMRMSIATTSSQRRSTGRTTITPFAWKYSTMTPQRHPSIWGGKWHCCASTISLSSSRCCGISSITSSGQLRGNLYVYEGWNKVAFGSQLVSSCFSYGCLRLSTSSSSHTWLTWRNSPRFACSMCCHSSQRFGSSSGRSLTSPMPMDGSWCRSIRLREEAGLLSSQLSHLF